MVFLQTLRNHPLGIKLGKLVPAQAWERRPSLVFGLSAFTVVASLLLGGGTRGGFLSDTILELLAIPAFLLSGSALFALPWVENKQRAEWALMLCAAVALVPLIQLVPLPPWLWSWLPNREDIVAVYTLLGRGLPWLPISVSPNATWVSALSLLSPLAIFLGVIQLGYRERRVLSLIVLGVGVFSAFLGLLQVAQGPSSPLRFFVFTNDTEAVGFFANRNHFAALLYSIMLFGAAWAVDVAFTAGSWTDRRNFETASILKPTAGFLILVVLIAAETITRSRAGLALMIIAIFGAFALPLADRRRSAGVSPIKLLFGSTILATTLAVQFALFRILDRFAVDPLEDSRVSFARNTIAAAKAYMPFGSGVGTFVPIYSIFEQPQDVLPNAFVNHAHDDVLEVWLEGGAVSVILVAAFLIWFALSAARIWRHAPAHAHAIDLLLARAATIVVPLLLAHSFVDYPLRTGAMMAVFAFSCALLVEPLVAAPARHRPHGAEEARSERELSRTAMPQAPAAAKEPEAALARPRPRSPERWGEDVDWPDEWRK
jgi:O-antigen ligase